MVRGNRFKLPFESTETFCAIFGQESGNYSAILRQGYCVVDMAKIGQESSNLRAILELFLGNSSWQIDERQNVCARRLRWLNTDSWSRGQLEDQPIWRIRRSFCLLKMIVAPIVIIAIATTIPMSRANPIGGVITVKVPANPLTSTL